MTTNQRHPSEHAWRNAMLAALAGIVVFGGWWWMGRTDETVVPTPPAGEPTTHASRARTAAVPATNTRPAEVFIRRGDTNEANETNSLPTDDTAGVVEPEPDEGADTDEATLATRERENDSPDNPTIQKARELAKRGDGSAMVELVALIGATEDLALKGELLDIAASAENADAQPVMEEVLRVAGDDDVVDVAEKVLAQGSGDSALSDIKQSYDDAEGTVSQERIVDVLRHIQDPFMVDKLLGLVKELESENRRGDSLWCGAVDALGNLGTPEAVIYLREQLSESVSAQNSLAHGIAMGALSRVNHPASQALLMEMVEAGLSDKASGDLCWAAVRALKFYPSRQTKALLTRVANVTTDDNIRAAAQKSLQVIERQ